MNAEFVEKIIGSGLTPEAYQDIMERQAKLDPTDFEGIEAEQIGFAQLNLHRAGRIRRTWQPSAELTALMERIDQPQVWLILTEPWCGDSAQCTPCLEVAASNHPSVTIRYLLRDDNLEIMDRYLTRGTRSIPILVALDPEGREQFRWGPRPAEAQAVIEAAIAEGLEKPERLEKLHLFYGRNRGRALDEGIVTILSSYLEGTS